MHQNDFGCVAGERLQPGPYRALTSRPAIDRLRNTEPFGGSGKPIAVVLMDHWQHQVDAGMRRENSQALAHHRRAAHCLVLLGIIQSAARSAPGCHHHRGYADRHVLPRLLLPNAGFSACVHHRKRLFVALISLGILLHRSTCSAAQNG